MSSHARFIAGGTTQMAITGTTVQSHSLNSIQIWKKKLCTSLVITKSDFRKDNLLIANNSLEYHFIS